MPPNALVLLITLLLAVALPTSRVEGRECDLGGVQIYQVSNGFGQGHIPEFRVQILNAAPTPVYNVHVACDEFASARLVNPHVFKRIKPNDCVVNDGKPLTANELLAFFYVKDHSINVEDHSIPMVD